MAQETAAEGQEDLVPLDSSARHVLPLVECQTVLFGAHGEQVMTTNGPAFVNNVHAPDVFADAATGFFIFGGNLRITFESLRVDHSSSPGPISRVVIGRLIMPVDQAENLAKGILDFLEQQRSQPTPNAQSSTSVN